MSLHRIHGRRKHNEVAAFAHESLEHWVIGQRALRRPAALDGLLQRARVDVDGEHLRARMHGADRSSERCADEAETDDGNALETRPICLR